MTTTETCGINIAVMRKWRNWQTRRLQVPVVAIPCGFKSRLPHSFFCKVRATYNFIFFLNAEVAELADAQASGACGSNTVRVQVPPSALFIFCLKELTEQTASSFFLYITFHNIQTKFKSKTGSSKIALCLRLLPGINKKIKKMEEKLFQAPLPSY